MKKTKKKIVKKPTKKVAKAKPDYIFAFEKNSKADLTFSEMVRTRKPLPHGVAPDNLSGNLRLTRGKKAGEYYGFKK